MCGTYSLRKSPREVRALVREGWYPLDIPDDLWQLSYKIKPSQAAPVIAGGSIAVMRWGFLPGWMREKGRAMINAKSETATEKPMFRAAIRQSRCIVLCDGFYEPKGKAKPRPWHFFQLADVGLLGLAGIYTGGTYAILTTEPSEDVAPIHERMPVILPMADWDAWLDPAVPPESLAPCYSPAAAPALESWPVSDDAKKASSPDGPNCIAAIDSGR